MARRGFEFETIDSFGEKHKYVCEFHPFESDANVLAWRLLELMSEPLAKMIPALFPSGGKMSSANLQSIAEELNFSGDELMIVVKDIGNLIGKLNMPALTNELLKYAVRDGKALSDPDNRDDAFSGNFGEVYKALYQIVRQNNFFPSLGTPKGLPSKVKSNTLK